MSRDREVRDKLFNFVRLTHSPTHFRKLHNICDVVLKSWVNWIKIAPDLLAGDSHMRFMCGPETEICRIRTKCISLKRHITFRLMWSRWSDPEYSQRLRVHIAKVEPLSAKSCLSEYNTCEMVCCCENELRDCSTYILNTTSNKNIYKPTLIARIRRQIPEK